MRLTQQRRNIIELFQQNPQKLYNAEMIFAALQASSLNLSTVYRNLEVLLANDIIDKIYLDSMHYYYLKDEQHHHFMICTKCHQYFPIDCLIHDLLPEISHHTQFKVTGHDLTLYGICPNCQLKESL